MSWNLESNAPRIEAPCQPQLLLGVVAEGKEWEDIIPEHLRSKVEEEERQQQLLELHLPPRSRKTIKQVCSWLGVLALSSTLLTSAIKKIQT